MHRDDDRNRPRCSEGEATISAEMEGAAHIWHKSRHLSDRHSIAFDLRNPGLSLDSADCHGWRIK
jgi:hypothetical protein